MRGQKLAIVISGILGAFILVLVALALLLTLAPRKFAEKAASYKMGRALTIGELHISFGDPIAIEIEDAHFANAAWGTEPDMVRVGHMTVELDPQSIFWGPLKIQKLHLRDTAIFLERNADGKGNWSFGKRERSPFIPNPDVILNAGVYGPGRETFPTLLDLAIDNSEVAMRTSSGQILHIDFKTWNLSAPSEESPVTLDVDGSYNHIPVQLKIKTDSFAIFHQPRRPFAVTIDGSAPSLSLHFVGNMMDPLDFDQIDAQFYADSTKLGQTAALLGEKFDGDIPLKFESILTRQGDVWHWEKIKGSFAGNHLQNSQIELIEGARFKPDSVSGVFDFESFNINSIGPQTSDNRPFSLPALSQNPGTLLDAKIMTKKLTGATFIAENVRLHAALQPGKVSIDNVAASIFGGEAEGSISAAALVKGNKIDLKIGVQNADVAQLMQAIGIKDRIIGGPLTSSIELTAHGETLGDFKSSTNGYVAFAVDKGKISSRTIQLASLDLLALFTDPSTMASLHCAVMVIDFKDGIGTLAPLRVESSTGILLGAGQINLDHNTLDLALQTDKDSTSGLALDKPIHITGDFDNIGVTPAVFSFGQVNNRTVLKPEQQLDSGLRQVLVGNACYR